jgi:hypothetical protein
MWSARFPSTFVRQMILRGQRQEEGCQKQQQAARA